ncbi:Protein XRI1 [Senna tora]|uniref:Protein XRI1 n=1 Tax=Senna tora TaxID=362788 RepID=A0A834WGK6_9FABA|nr:Protein XRI1 [Senna tora]
MEWEIEATHSDSSLDAAAAESWLSSDPSTGYLEDAIAGWGIWCKKENSPSYYLDQKESLYLDDQVNLFSTCSATTAQFFDDSQKFNTSGQSSSQNDMHAASIKDNASQRSWASGESDENDASISKSQWKKIAYPFELVKPGGMEGVTTLKDINEQMVMSPAKPIPHPVRDSATSPSFSAPNFGMSGKAVVALTRIHTQGRGSITIMRTKG